MKYKFSILTVCQNDTRRPFLKAYINAMKKLCLIIAINNLALFLFAQTPEWEAYCKLRDIVGHETLQADSAFNLYYTMDSIYNGIPFFTDLYDYLETSIAVGNQEKTKELAFRLVQWKCWDNRFFDQQNLEIIKQTDYWPRLDSLSRNYGNKIIHTDYIKKLYSMKERDQQYRGLLRNKLTKEETDSLWAVIHHTDSVNLQQLKELIEVYGFPTWEKVGYHFAFCAWLVAQHADSIFISQYVEYLRKAVANNNANPSNLAYMIDRDLMNKNLPQLYGTQFIGVYNDNNTLENMLWPVENMERLNTRRERMLLAPMDITKFKIYDY